MHKIDNKMSWDTDTQLLFMNAMHKFTLHGYKGLCFCDNARLFDEQFPNSSPHLMVISSLIIVLTESLKAEFTWVTYRLTIATSAPSSDSM